MPVATQTFYEILGIDEDATPEDVSAARRSMIKAVHPDLAIDEADRQEREQLSRAVNDMCDTLLDPIRRYDYDVGVARARRWPDGDPHTEDPSGHADTWRPGDWSRPAFEAADLEGDYWDVPLDAEASDTDGIHPLIERLPALARLEEWLTWPIGILAVFMLGAATYFYDAAGSRLLGEVGLHFGRFGSLVVVIILAALLVALCLGVIRLIRKAMRR